LATSWIFGALFVGFFVYITVKGELGLYQAAIFKSSTDKANQTAAQQLGIGGFNI